MLVSLTQRHAPQPSQELTERERKIPWLNGGGMTNHEIGDKLFLAEQTIEHYATTILQKLHVRCRVEAALLASRQYPGRFAP